MHPDPEQDIEGDDLPEEEAEEVYAPRRPFIYKDEEIGFGCTVKVIDNERLDKN